LPAAELLLPYLRLIDESRFYSNGGALHQRLEERLAAHYGIRSEQLALAASGTTALIAALLAVTRGKQGDRRLVVCPSYSFAATAAAIEACGFTPYFADISADSWALDPARLARDRVLDRTAAILAVAPYGRAIDVSTWQRLSAERGIPVVIDAAAGFDTVDAGAVAAGDVLTVLSLHATKVFSTAEGGLVMGGDPHLIRRVVQGLNFGFAGGRQSLHQGINGKLSEYHAAVGLAELDGWAAKRQGFRASAEAYGRRAATHGLDTKILATTTRATPYALFQAVDADESLRVRSALAAANIESRFWYGYGLHLQPHFANCPMGELPVTRAVAPRLLGLPMAVDLSDADVGRIMAIVAQAQAN
jgi:dTDP-4-amino-4,6-dideoxygalactose transaminase